MNAETFDRLMLRAIEQEIEARDFYQEAAGRVSDTSVKEILQEMARQEQSHMDRLEKLRADPQAQMQFERVEDFGVAEQEEMPLISTDLSPKDAFGLAMKKEQAALETYTRWAAMASSDEVRRIYEELAEMERGHKARIEDLFVNAAFPEVW